MWTHRSSERLLAGSIGSLLEYDWRRGTDLTGPLSAYYVHHANVAATARALYLHVNTLLKRLDRAGTVLGSRLAPRERPRAAARAAAAPAPGDQYK